MKMASTVLLQIVLLILLTEDVKAKTGLIKADLGSQDHFGNQSDVFCMDYHNNYTPMPTTYAGNTSIPVANYISTKGCVDNDYKNIAGKIVAVGSSNCTYEEKAAIIQRLHGKAALIIMDKNTTEIFPLDSKYHKTNITMVRMFFSDFASLIALDSQIKIWFYAPDYSYFDPSLIILLCPATICVVLASCWSASVQNKTKSQHRYSFKDRKVHEENKKEMEDRLNCTDVHGGEREYRKKKTEDRLSFDDRKVGKEVRKEMEDSFKDGDSVEKQEMKNTVKDIIIFKDRNIGEEEGKKIRAKERLCLNNRNISEEEGKKKKAKERPTFIDRNIDEEVGKKKKAKERPTFIDRNIDEEGGKKKKANERPTFIDRNIDEEGGKKKKAKNRFNDGNIGEEKEKKESDGRLAEEEERKKQKTNVVKKEQNKKKVNDRTVGICWGVSTVIGACIFITLLYFFYGYIIYVMITSFSLCGAWGLFHAFLFLWKKSLPCNKSPVLRNLFLLLLAIGVVVAWIVVRKESFAWILQDIIGFFICIRIICSIHLANFKICFAVLFLFVVYDVFMVYISSLFTNDGVNIMARAFLSASQPSERNPMLMILPFATPQSLSECIIRQGYSGLGLGDIILPGLVTSYNCAFDLNIHNPLHGRCHFFYFISSVVAYVVGLLLAMTPVIITGSIQPALLYIGPCIILTTVISAAIRGDLGHMWRGDLKIGDVESAKTLPAGSIVPVDNMEHEEEEEETEIEEDHV